MLKRGVEAPATVRLLPAFADRVADRLQIAIEAAGLLELVAPRRAGLRGAASGYGSRPTPAPQMPKDRCSVKMVAGPRFEPTHQRSAALQLGRNLVARSAFQLVTMRLRA